MPINLSHSENLIDTLATTRDLYIMLSIYIINATTDCYRKKPYQLSRWQGMVMLPLYFTYQVMIILPFMKVNHEPIKQDTMGT